jgi:hypothetical protein
MPTPEHQSEAIARSNEEFAKLERDLSSMQGAVENMPSPRRDSFEETLAECQKVIAKLQARFASLSGQEASTSRRDDPKHPREDPKPPRMPTFECPPVPRMQAGEQSSGQEVPEEDSGEKARQQEEEEQPLHDSLMWGQWEDFQREIREQEAREREEDWFLWSGHPEDQEAREQEEEETQQRLRDEFCTLFEAFKSRVSYVEGLSDDFSSMETLDQKREAIVRLEEQPNMMQEEVCGMQRAIEMMPRPDDETFEETLGRCQYVFGQFCSWFSKQLTDTGS